MIVGRGRKAPLCTAQQAHNGEQTISGAGQQQWQPTYQVRKAPGSFNPNADTIKVLTMHASKGPEFAVVALMG